MPFSTAIRALRLRQAVFPSSSFKRGLSIFTVQRQNRFNNKNSRSTSYKSLLAAAAALAASSTLVLCDASVANPQEQKRTIAKVDYNAVRQSIADLLDDENWDDGSWGPVFVRLAWHCSGSYSKYENNGGSNGALMRFEPEAHWGGNKGLAYARDRLEKVKAQHPNITYADLYTLAGVVAIKEMGGPEVKWRPGRTDWADGKLSPMKDDRLPDGGQGADHIRHVFYRMGFNDQEIVALSGAHALGRCHIDRSGFDGPWTRSPTTFSNSYFKILLDEKWYHRKWNGPRQYENSNSGKDLMMLESDLALVNDEDFRKYVIEYANNEVKFFNDFAKAFEKLLELGVPFPKQSFMSRLFGKA